ncbi:MAG: hypothetical protein JWO80_4831 [Bryobacterales bacterium]|nr:hypothetical protein [Bryobacterales bacterium]
MRGVAQNGLRSSRWTRNVDMLHYRYPNRSDIRRIVSTRGALEACPPDHLLRCLARQAHGDSGEVCKENAATERPSARVCLSSPLTRLTPPRPAQGSENIRSDHH